jgi:hypothetical protein
VTTLAQTALILQELAATFRVEVDSSDTLRWHRQLEKFDVAQVQTALEAVQSSPSQFMPTPGVFAETVRSLGRGHVAPISDCRTCDGARWVLGPPLTNGSLVYETTMPCGACSPALLDAARSKVKENRQNFHAADRLLDYRLADQLERARDALHQSETNP